MSQSYSLYCEDTKQQCLAGQSTYTNTAGVLVYSSPDDAAAIARFLQATAGHPVVLRECDSVPFDWHDFEEFNDDLGHEGCPRPTNG